MNKKSPDTSSAKVAVAYSGEIVRGTLDVKEGRTTAPGYLTESGTYLDVCREPQYIFVFDTIVTNLIIVIFFRTDHHDGKTRNRYRCEYPYPH